MGDTGFEYLREWNFTLWLLIKNYRCLFTLFMIYWMVLLRV